MSWQEYRGEDDKEFFGTATRALYVTKEEWAILCNQRDELIRLRIENKSLKRRCHPSCPVLSREIRAHASELRGQRRLIVALAVVVFVFFSAAYLFLRL